jgi:PAS domain S-box-containing protein
LAEQESQLRATMESALDGIVVIDDQGIIREFNDAASKIFGFEQRDAIGSDMAELIIPSHLRDAHHNGMHHYLKTGEGPVLGKRITVPGLCKDGREITLELAINPAQSSKGELFIAYMRDITENLAQQKALEEAKAAAEQAAQAKSAFLAIMSHEIRTPLNGLLGLLEMLESEICDPDIHRKSVTALDSALALTELLNSILDYSRLEAEKVELKEREFELRPFLKKTMDLVLPNLEKKGLAASIEVDPALPHFVFYDEMRLRQMLLNLLGNAIKFTRDGSILLYAEQSRKTDILCFHVEDTGIGIETQNIPHLFERFNMLDSSLNREVGGSGLGLAITKSLAELMNGSIQVSSKKNIGSTFTLELPLREGRGTLQAVESREVSEIDQRLSGLSVLLAEDNPTNRLVLGSSLQSFGMIVTNVENGQQAVEQVQNDNVYDLIILDISMPVMDGLEAVGHIRKLSGYEQCPILAFTAYGQDEERDEFLRAGFDAILSKPTRKASLFQTLSDLLKKTSDINPDHSRQTSSDMQSDLLDQTVLAPMFEDIPSELAIKLAQNCLSDMTSNVSLLRSSWQTNDWKNVHRASHILKGVTATFGMNRLSIPASKIADLTREIPGTIEQKKIEEAMDVIQDIFDPTLAALVLAFEGFGLNGLMETKMQGED